MIDVETHSENETVALGIVIGKMLAAGDVLALKGNLGAGKTHFVKGIARGMGIEENVVSPTFTILNYYEHTIPLLHFDFYRLEEEYELDDLGFDDYITNGITVIEWAEKFLDRLPSHAAIISIEKSSSMDRIFHMEFNDDKWIHIEKEVKRYVTSR